MLPLVNDIRTVAQSRRLPLTVQKTHYLSLHWFSSVPIGLRFIYCLIIYRTIHWCPWTSVVEPRWRQRRGFLQSVDSITIREFHRVFPVNRTHIDIHTQSRKEIARKQHLLTLWSESSTLTVQLLTSTLTPTSYSSEEGVVAWWSTLEFECNKPSWRSEHSHSRWVELSLSVAVIRTAVSMPI